MDYLKKLINKSENAKIKDDPMNNLKYVSGENSISSSVKSGAGAMNNFYRTSLPNFVLFLRIAVMTIILAFIYFLLREYRCFSREVVEKGMKIAVLYEVNKKYFGYPSTIEFMISGDQTVESPWLLRSMKKHFKNLKKQNAAK